MSYLLTNNYQLKSLIFHISGGVRISGRNFYTYVTPLLIETPNRENPL
jgi:hypothetical protein